MANPSSNDSSSAENLSNDVTHPVTPPPQPLNEGHEADDVAEVEETISDDVIASEDSSSVSVSVTPPPPTLTDAVAVNVSGDVTNVDASSSVSCPVTPSSSQPLTEALNVANLDVPILDVADDNRRGGRSSRRRKKVLRRIGISCYAVGIRYGDNMNRHVYDEDQCNDADHEDDVDDEDQCNDADEADDGDYYDDDVDDELIPRSVSKKIKRERMRKTFERGFTKRG